MAKTYCPLDIHTTGSFLESPFKIPDLIEVLKEKGIKSAGITDKGNISLSYKFSTEAGKANIKPIIGQEFYICEDISIRDIKGSPNYNIKIIAKNKKGYKNLCYLSTISSFDENFYFNQRIDFKLLNKHKEGLIILSSNIRGPIGYNVIRKNFDIANKFVQLLKKNFSPNLFLNLGCNITDKQILVNDYYIQCSRKYGIPLVMTPDTFYRKREDKDLQTVLWTIKERSKNNRIFFNDVAPLNETDELYLKSYKEVLESGIKSVSKENISIIEHSIKNTNLISDMVEFNFDVNEDNSPTFEIKTTKYKTSIEMLKALSNSWLKKQKFVKEKYDIYKKQLDFELSVIETKNYSDYFLVTKDFTDWCRKNNLLIGYGRGSAAGSLVTFSLAITDLDPIKHKLKFERFLDLDRIEMPDIDIDIEDDRRPEAIQYLKDRWGKENVSHMGTFSKFKIKSAFLDVFKVHNKEKIWLDIKSNLPEAVHVRDDDDALMEAEDMTMKDILQEYPVLTGFREKYRKEFDQAEALLGCYRGSSAHASGIIISKRPIIETVPLAYKVSKDKKKEKKLATQFDMDDCEKSKLVKFDILGLRSLRVKRLMTESVFKNHGKKIQVTEDDLEDGNIYTLIQKGITQGIFQVETYTGTKTAQQVGVHNLETMSVSVALGRPGPINNGFVKDYEDRRLGLKSVDYFVSDFKEILQETLGIMTYQEQIMEISRVYAGYTRAESNKFRKAMGKKIPTLMKEQEDKFINGAIAKNKSKDEAQLLFDNISKFAEYGFNASHAKAYAKLSCVMLWFKYYYPLEFWEAVLTTEARATKDSADKIPTYLIECRDKMGIKILSHDINYSKIHSSIEKGCIRLGYDIIKHVDLESMEEIISKAPYISINDFYHKININKINKKSFYQIVFAKGFDNFLKKEGLTKKYLIRSYLILSEEKKYRQNKGTRANKDFNHKWTFRRRFVDILNRHNNLIFDIKCGDPDFAEEYDYEQTTPDKIKILKKRNSPIVKGLDYLDEFDTEDFVNIKEWVKEINSEEFSELKLYLYEKEAMRISLDINIFEKYEKHYKNKALKTIRSIVTNEELEDFSTIKFLGFVDEFKEKTDKKKKELKGSLLIVDKSGEMRTSIPVKNYKEITFQIKKGDVYIFSGKILPKNSGSDIRYVYIEKIVKKID